MDEVGSVVTKLNCNEAILNTIDRAVKIKLKANTADSRLKLILIKFFKTAVHKIHFHGYNSTSSVPKTDRLSTVKVAIKHCA